LQEKNNIEETQKSSNIKLKITKITKIIFFKNIKLKIKKIILENLYYFHNQLIQTIIFLKT
jgi:hypothetical protein